MKEVIFNYRRMEKGYTWDTYKTGDKYIIGNKEVTCTDITHQIGSCITVTFSNGGFERIFEKHIYKFIQY